MSKRSFTSTYNHRSITGASEKKPYDTKGAPDSHYSQPAAEVSHDVTQAEKDHFSRVERESKELQTRSPWTREGSDVPPVARSPDARPMTKGKLLTTPSRMLKLILPITTDVDQNPSDAEPLALLVHPQQPLSYLERLIQAELPMVWDEKKGRERAPNVNFRAEDSAEEDETLDAESMSHHRSSETEEQEQYDLENPEETFISGKNERTGKISGGKKKSSSSPASTKDSAHSKDNMPVDNQNPTFVRWSPSTEIGDFIRDAARGKEFAVDIEGASEPIFVNVPSFSDRTYYLRMRLRKIAGRISSLADVKKECDDLAHRAAKNVARGGFLGLLGWWGGVYYCTFMRPDLGWDVMEPVTYLVGLSGLIGGYLWFLYHNREASYRNAMHVTISRRQSMLYEKKGFNLATWEALIDEGNRLRREIKMVADEYDVDWDETKDEGDAKVRDALRKERLKQEGKRKEGDEDKEDDKDGDGR
jgi:hypothetical protein